METVLFEAEAAEDVDVGGVGAHLLERKVDLKLRELGLVVRSDDRGTLTEATFSPAPTGPETEFEEGDGELGSRDRGDDTDESLLAAGFRPDVLAQDAGLEIGQDGRIFDGENWLGAAQ
ncbi:MAG: hypothetical protein WA771_00505 [Chthoniobacterales bacterium]